MHELREQPKVKNERAIDSLPFWMRQMMKERMRRCLEAEAEERLVEEETQVASEVLKRMEVNKDH
jgi:hypothetical protein